VRLRIEKLDDVCGLPKGDSAILPGMPAAGSAKPHIAIVGAGNLATALTVSLRAAGYGIEQIISRAGGASLRRARRLAREVEAGAVSASQVQPIEAKIVWFCVPDHAIAHAAESLSKGTAWKGKVALHSSGALTSDELVALRRRGAAVASVHPLMTFVRGSRPALAEVPFAIEGDSKAARIARSIIRDLRGWAFSIGKEQKQLYHAWGMFVSPLFTALLASSEDVAAAAGINRKAARAKMLPILMQTLANYARLGAPGSFSGPIARGDLETVKKHLTVLREIAGAREVYIALAHMALRDLSVKNRTGLEKILK
jgi:predicted short-subunit dehydrogenase-like oxidoreductase (DUF2520 family)